MSSCVCVINMCILVPAFSVSCCLVYSLLPGVSCLCQPCLVLPCPDVFIKDYYLSLRPRQRVPVFSSCVHRYKGRQNGHLNHFYGVKSSLLNLFFNMHTPAECVVPWDIHKSRPHCDLQKFKSSTDEWLSCRKQKSQLNCLRYKKIAFHLVRFLSPLAFKETTDKAIN